VFAGLADPVELGFVAILARPGGNITGFANFERSLIGKYLLLKELAPRLARVAVVMSSGSDRFGISENTASQFGIKPVVMPVSGAAEIERAIAAFAREPDGGLLLPGDAGIIVHRATLIF
jgi:putative ABC transport system substrate-binding protein